MTDSTRIVSRDSVKKAVREYMATSTHLMDVNAMGDWLYEHAGTPAERTLSSAKASLMLRTAMKSLGDSYGTAMAALGTLAGLTDEENERVHADCRDLNMQYGTMLETLEDLATLLQKASAEAGR